MLHSVIQVKPNRDFTVYIYFSDGTIKLYNMSPFLGKGVFKQISEPDVFVDLCCVINGTLAWDIGGNFDEQQCLDIDPETLYSEGVNVSDPLIDGVA